MLHPISERWPATKPDAIQLYSMATPNGVKVSAMLEELGVDYEPHLVDILKGDQHTDAFRALNPNSKIPALIDPKGPNGEPIGLWESGTILVYLAEKFGRFLPTEPAARLETLQWLFWQVGGVGPNFGQFGFFKSFGGRTWEDKRPLERYAAESRRLIGVLDDRLDGRDFIMGDAYTIADMAVWPWVRTMDTYHKAYDVIGVDTSRNVEAWLERTADRPASQRALEIPAR